MSEWTAKYIDCVKRDDHVAFSIVYTKDSQKVVREYVASEAPDGEVIRRIALEEIARLNAVDTGGVVIAPGTPIDTTKDPAIEPPTREELARVAFLNSWRTYQRYQRGIRLPGVAELAAALEQELNDTFLIEYTDWL